MECLILMCQNYAQELSTETLYLSQVNTAHVHQWRNNPQAHYTRLISSNVRLLNEPIYYMGAKDTKTKQHHWWPAEESHMYHYTPPNYRAPKELIYENYSCSFRGQYCCVNGWKIAWKTADKGVVATGTESLMVQFLNCPAEGTVLLANPRASKGLSEILQKQTSFSHQYNARDSANEPIQRKRHGAFVCAEIKPASAIVPRGTEIFLSARGSCSLEQPKTEKGNSVKSRMTSPSLFLQNSETVGSENHLSKPDVKEIAKAYPRIPVRGHKSSGTSQTTEVDVGCSAGEEPFASYNEMAFDRWGGLPTVHKSMQTLIPPSATETKRA
ncbi:LOW QUALITY PROTEIN: ciliary microtubule inner protein 6 [Sarcoramphus papa]